MLVAFLAAEIYCWATKKGWQIKMPDSVPPAVAKSFAALIPAVLTLSIFLFVNAGLTGFFNANLHDIIYKVIQTPLVGLGSSIWATLVAIFFVQFLWFLDFMDKFLLILSWIQFGIH